MQPLLRALSAPRKRRHNFRIGLVIWLTLAASSFAQDAAQIDLPRTKLSAGMHLIDVQVARTPQHRQTGLMFRKNMPQREGMLFVFEEPGRQCFWMKNTFLPLTAAFIDDDGTIVNTEDMAPKTTEPHCSKRPVRFVLEMNLGWFESKGIKAGSRLGGEPFLAKR